MSIASTMMSTKSGLVCGSFGRQADYFVEGRLAALVYDLQDFG